MFFLQWSLHIYYYVIVYKCNLIFCLFCYDFESYCSYYLIKLLIVCTITFSKPKFLQFVNYKILLQKVFNTRHIVATMVSCISCKISHVVRGRKGISFHRFPANPILRKSWLEFLKLKESELPIRAHLCSQHFDETSFDRSSRLKVQLKRDAIPSILILRKRNDRKSTGGIIIKEEHDVPNEKTKNSLIDDETHSSIKIECDIDISDTKVEESY